MDLQRLLNWDWIGNSGLQVLYVSVPGRMGGTRIFDIAHGLIGTLSGAAFGTTKRANAFGEFRYTSTAHYIQVAPHAYVNALSKFTWMAWINPTTFGGGSKGYIIFKADSGGPLLSLLDAAPSTGNGIRFNASFSIGDGSWYVDGVISTNVWQHVAVTYDNSSTSNVPIIYVNGSDGTVNVSTSPSGTATDDTSSNLMFGHTSIGDDTRTFDGAIDDIRIFRRMLTKAEINMIMNEGQVGYPNTFNWLEVDKDAESLLIKLKDNVVLAQL